MKAEEVERGSRGVEKWREGGGGGGRGESWRADFGGGGVIAVESGHRGSAPTCEEKQKGCVCCRSVTLFVTVLQRPNRQYCISTAACQQRVVFILEPTTRGRPFNRHDIHFRSHLLLPLKS